MGKRFLVVTFIISALFVVSVGCDNNPEQNRSVVTITSMNGNSPLMSDVLEQGEIVSDDTGFVLDDDYVAEDWIPVEFFNRPYSDVITTGPGEPHGDFVITGYRVEWTRTDGGSPALPTYVAGVNIMVPSGKTVDALIQVVTYKNKINAPLLGLRYVSDQIFMNAHITFYGHELGTDRDTKIEADLGVSFADVLVTSG